jgi:hypothetical protein
VSRQKFFDESNVGGIMAHELAVKLHSVHRTIVADVSFNAAINLAIKATISA